MKTDPHCDSFHSNLGSASYHGSGFHVRVLHLPRAHADRNEAVKSLFFRGYRKPERAESNFPIFLLPEIPKVQFINYYCGQNSTKKAQNVKSLTKWPNEHSAPSSTAGFSGFPSAGGCCPPKSLSPSKARQVSHTAGTNRAKPAPAALIRVQISHLQLFLTVWEEPE